LCRYILSGGVREEGTEADRECRAGLQVDWFVPMVLGHGAWVYEIRGERGSDKFQVYLGMEAVR
jgi:hypothetical protein